MKQKGDHSRPGSRERNKEETAQHQTPNKEGGKHNQHAHLSSAERRAPNSRERHISSPGWYSPLRSTGNFMADGSFVGSGGSRPDFKTHIENL